jgi:hypothetical protein
VSGFKVVDPISNAAFTPSYSTRTLHIIGKNDVIVVEERSRLLVEVSENGQVEEHSGGRYRCIALTSINDHDRFAI